MKLLLIEDDFSVASPVQAVLHAEDDTCDVTLSGRRGLELALSGDYQAIILDLILPDLDGMAVLEKLRAANNKTPVLILSSVSDVAKKISCFQLGADDYLDKPFETGELVAHLSQSCHGWRRLYLNRLGQRLRAAPRRERHGQRIRDDAAI
jgi:DNA-binding response OmpR family regulator